MKVDPSQLVITSEPKRTANGTPYLVGPGVAIIAAPQFFPMNTTPFIQSFGDVFDAADYENDFYQHNDHGGFGGGPDADDRADHVLKHEDGESLVKFAGQLCYLSFGEGRTRGEDMDKYLTGIKDQRHGSVLSHAVFSLLIWGVDRAWSHEAVRHATGSAFSQMSQRYVDGKTLRFVEREEYQRDPELHARFEYWIDQAREEYDARAAGLIRSLKLEGMSKRDARKKVNSAARNCLPNETETAMVWTGNVRTWRHVIEQRASKFADSPINRFAKCAHKLLTTAAPHFFSDYEADADGNLSTKYLKV